MRLIMVPVEGDVMDELLDLRQAADFLGISEKSLLRLLSQEELPARKIVGKWRFSKDALIMWIATGNSKLYSKSSGDDEVED